MINEGKVLRDVLKRFQKKQPVLRIETDGGLFVSPTEWMLVKIPEGLDVFKEELYKNGDAFYAKRLQAPPEDAKLTGELVNSRGLLLRKLCRQKDRKIVYIRDEAFKYFKPTGQECFSLDGSDRYMTARIYPSGTDKCFMLTTVFTKI